MKLAEIKVGDDYVYGTRERQGSYQRVQVTEVGRHPVLKGGHSVPAARISVTGQASYVKWVSIRSIIMPWAEYEAQRPSQDPQRQYDQTMVVRVNDVVAGLTELRMPTGTLPSQLDDSQIHAGWVKVRVEFLEDVAGLIYRADLASKGS